MKSQVIHTDRVPPGQARISQAVIFGNLVFVSGIVARESTTGAVTAGGVAAQTERVLKCIEAILDAAGTSLPYVLKMTCYLRDLEEFDAFNRVWERWFPENPPARICVQAGRLGPGFDVEIDAIAGLPDA